MLKTSKLRLSLSPRVLKQFSFPGNACAAQQETKAGLVGFSFDVRGCESQQPASFLLAEGHKPEAIPDASSSLTPGTSFTALRLLSVLSEECVPSGKDISVGCLLWSPVLQWLLQEARYFPLLQKKLWLWLAPEILNGVCLFV